MIKYVFFDQIPKNTGLSLWLGMISYADFNCSLQKSIYAGQNRFEADFEKSETLVHRY